MSLKDRLKSTQKVAPTKAPKPQSELKYYASDEDANVGTLGVIDSLLYDDDLNSIFVSGAKNIYLDKKGKTYKSTTAFRDNVQLENIIKKAAAAQGIEYDEKKPCFKFNHKLGVNVLATLPPLSGCATLFVKSYKDKHATAQKLQEDHAVSKEIALVLEALCAIRKNILIVGEKAALKTTLLSALAKKVPNNNRAVLIDNQKELKIEAPNFTSYDFADFKDSSNLDELLNLIVFSNPDKLFINDEDSEILSKVIKAGRVNYSGIVATLSVQDANEVIEYLTKALIKEDSYLTLEKAKALVLNTFDIIIQTKKDDIGRRKVSSISQINLLAKNGFVEEIFNIDYLQQHKSTGIIPEFYEDIKQNSLPISDNIFDENYKHTYHKNAQQDTLSALGSKGGNIDILRKFKKDLPTLNQEQNVETQQIEAPEEKPIEQMSNDEIMKKAQEKFDEIKKNVQMQGEIKAEFVENSNEENLNETQNENV